MIVGTYGNSPMKASSETESEGAKSRPHSDQSAMFQQQVSAEPVYMICSINFMVFNVVLHISELLIIVT